MKVNWPARNQNAMSKPCLDVLKALPLDVRTLKTLSEKLRSSSKPEELVSLLRQYELTRDTKTLENIIHRTYFQWSSTLPPHLHSFRKHYVELRNHWPYECHRSILFMESPKSQSLRFMWSNDSPRALTTMHYNLHSWASHEEQQPAPLANLQRTVLFHELFQHYMFLKRNPHLCKNRKTLAIPIVEIPMKPLGQTIPDSRIRNLFKRKVAYVWKVLAQENPPLSTSQEQCLAEIVDSPLPSSTVESRRSLQRMYRRACKGAYVIRPHSDLGLDIAESSLLKKL
ncbi:LAME_0G08702g1_1 [Lachancea meyersii CBS 8951]|uniref:Genetic interactor of prohibitin 5, mitochondrial n=1 Tax=Lachancea meyersii CBS 8951 TaxID=1266667 RepID=A0A1G4K8B6_9SACH|nr:LAME_0G08702g1_1 [Lachancea meyersii CBS 8951]